MEGENSGAVMPKKPPACPKWPDPGCQVPPAVSRASVGGSSLLHHLRWLSTAHVLDPQNPQTLPSPCTGEQHWLQGLHKPVAVHLWNKCRAPGSLQPPRRWLSAPLRHKKRREGWKMDAQSTPSPAALPQDTKAPLRTDFTPLLQRCPN